ncbi:MAG: tRNA 2-thiocytidine biosynthesis protein TtcA [Lachnospiraceae bacterium]|nr:tRNA 2-thiocytidine biosynthesis protein TtcA [Ruminococcus sp.]MCM1273932.1 tRNA 2-thiocytidine biosynthesis protein TtcA [Lachnospiraceae bacterium]
MEENAVINSLHGEFARTITRKFSKAVEEFELLKSGDKICVCVSGGKDSMLLAALFRDYERRGSVPVSVRYLAMDPGYSEENFSRIIGSAKRLGLPLETFTTEIFRHTESAENACFLCSKMRRGHLYNKARELGCNKIALGHHFDDVIESTLMGMLYGGQTQTMLPKLRARNYEGMELIRPLFYVRERDIIAWRDCNELQFLQCACGITQRGEGSKRQLVKRLIAELAAENPQVEQNIFRSVCAVRLDRIISYKDKDGVHTFLDNYDDELF